jgi:hypothetical protein
MTHRYGSVGDGTAGVGRLLRLTGREGTEAQCNGELHGLIEQEADPALGRRQEGGVVSDSLTTTESFSAGPQMH